MRIYTEYGYYTVNELGNFHSENDEPAIVISSYEKEENGIIEQHEGYKAWYNNGKLHRENNPAVIRDSGLEFFYLEGELCQ